MRTLLLSVAIVVAVPLLAFGVARGAMWGVEREWQKVLAQKYPDSDPAKRAAYTISGVCAENQGSRQGICEHLDNLDTVALAAVATGAAGLGWLAVIAIIGRIARRSRRLLLWAFAPAVHLTNLIVVVLMLATCGLAAAAAYFGETAISNSYHPKIILLLGIGGLLGTAAMFKASRAMVRKVTPFALGRLLPPGHSPELRRTVAEVAKAVGTAPPENIIVGGEPNFWVVETPVNVAGEKCEGRSLFLSLPMLHILTDEEFRAILAHEMGHFSGQDTAYSRRFVPIYRGTATALSELSSNTGEGVASVAILPGLFVMAYFMESFAVAESTISRDREIRADSVAGRVTSPAALACALVKVHAYAGAWAYMSQRMEEALRAGKMFTNVSETFAAVVRDNARPDLLAGLDQKTQAHPTDSHPPLGTRLVSLGLSVSAVEAAALHVEPQRPAALLVDDRSALEESVSTLEHMIVARRCGIDLDGDTTASSDPDPGLDNGTPPAGAAPA